MTMSGLSSNLDYGKLAATGSVLGEIMPRMESVLASTAVGHAKGVFGRTIHGHGTGVISPSEPRGLSPLVVWRAVGLPPLLSNQRAVTDISLNATTYRSLLEVLDRIAVFSGLPDDWDSYGGVKLSEEARQAALQFVMQLLADKLLDAARELDVLPTPTGGIQFEWSGSGGSLEVEIDQEGHFHSLIESTVGGLEESSRDRPLSWLEMRSHIRSIAG